RRSTRPPSTAASQSPKLRLERLEDRTLPAVNLAGIPDWLDLGPAPIAGGQSDTDNAHKNEVAGAINAIAIDPIAPGRAYVGSTNGGIWRTDNLKDLNGVSWVPLTDQQPSLSIASLAISPLNRAVIYAGIGRSSSWGFDGGSLTGVLRSSDGGDT